MPHGDGVTCITTYTAKKFYPLDPHIDDICIEDIAHSLSLQCRYTGHCRRHFSTAQHSVYVAEVVMQTDPALGLTALLHDASEAYFADVAGPVKKVIPRLVRIEKRLERVIAKKFGLKFPFPPVIKTADTVLLITEQRDLMQEINEHNSVKPLNKVIKPWTSGKAEKEFLRLFDKLRGNHGTRHS